MNVKVEEFSGTPAAWDAAVRAIPGATHCHLSGWRTVIEGALGHRCHQLVARDTHGAIVGLLPLGHVRSRIFGDYLISMPFLNVGGAIGTTEARVALEAAAVERARSAGVDLLELRGRAAPAGGTLGVSARKITVELALPPDLAVLRKGFHQKLRANINKAPKAGLEMRYGADQVAGFYEVFARNMRDLGTPVLPLSFFESIARELADVVHFGALWDKERPVAGQCAFAFGGAMELVWGSALYEYHRLKVSSHIHWAFLERAASLGCTVVDFGRCTEGSGTHQFKQQWGGVDVPLPWGQWSPKGVVSPPSPNSPLFRAAVATWQRLPLAVTNRVGPLLSRSLP